MTLPQSETKDRRLAAYHFLATGFYSGLAPKAPGTAGTFTAALLYFLTIRAGGLDPSGSAVGILSLAVFFAGVAVTNHLQRNHYYGPDLKDPQCVVIDEFAGYFVALAGHGNSTWTIFLAFAAFRLFDITKPPPIRRLEKLPLGWGIMADDMFAGVYANMLLYLLNFLN